MKRNLGIDFLKFVAAIFITNSHFIPVYKDVNISLATLGVHGNALFFFVSGYLLTMGFSKNKQSFGNWYKRRLQRLWPAVFLWALISSILWQDNLTWEKILIAPEYWFLQSIAVSYLLFFFVGDMLVKNDRNGCFMLIGAIFTSIVYAFIMPQGNGSIFHTSLHYVCHFSIMIMGGIIYINKNEMKMKKLYLDLIWLGTSFIAYFIILNFGKKATGFLWYTQLFALIPLHTFCYYAYKVVSHNWTEKLMTHKIIKWPFRVIASLTLEIYIVQFDVISDRYNNLFPLNWFIVFGMIVISAYVLRICVNIFLQFVNDNPWNLKQCFVVK